MTYMGQLPSGGFRTWTCECGRMHLAFGLDECPDCAKPRPGAELAVDSVVPETVPPPAPPVRTPRTRTRTRSARGGGAHG